MDDDRFKNDEDEDLKWLTGIVEGASKLEVEVKPVRGTIISPRGLKIEVTDAIARTSRYNLYGCKVQEEATVLKVAQNLLLNDTLAKEAKVLGILQDEAEEVERLNRGEKSFNYDLFFPQLIESFDEPTQGDRRLNVLGLHVDERSQLVALSNLIDKERVRVDPRTSVWIFGKTLKILSFAHKLGIANNLVLTSNILIEKAQHGLVIFDWTNSLVFPDETDSEVARNEIMQTAKLCQKLLGADNEGRLPASDQLKDSSYEEMIKELASGKFSDAGKAHDHFYEVAWACWPRKYAEFTTYPLD